DFVGGGLLLFGSGGDFGGGGVDLNAGLLDLHDHAVQTINHFVESSRQLSHFVLGFYFHLLGEVALLGGGAGRSGQLPNGGGDTANNKQGQHGRGQQSRGRERGGSHPQLLKVLDAFLQQHVQFVHGHLPQ